MTTSEATAVKMMLGWEPRSNMQALIPMVDILPRLGPVNQRWVQTVKI